MKIKKRMSQKRPKFRKYESWRYKRLKNYWRKPTGIDNKMRQKRKGWPKSVKIGYRSPKKIRNLHPSRLNEIMIFNVGDLTIIDPESQIARIGGSVGGRKRALIIKEASNRGIRVLNSGDVQIEETDIQEGYEEELFEESSEDFEE
jgi:large subunit ribosomal protein L32e